MYIPIMPDYLIMGCIKGDKSDAIYIPKRSQRIKNKRLRAKNRRR